MSDTGIERPTVLAFHKLTDRLTFGSTNFPPRRFERLLTLLKDSGWDLSGGEMRTEGAPGRAVRITFDDAYQHLLVTLPELMERFKFRPLVFVPTGLIGRSNRWDYSHFVRPMEHLNRASIRRLAEMGVSFGSHGHSHTDMTSLDAGRLGAELLFSRATLEDLTGRRVTAISYPFGRCDDRIHKAASAAGYEEGFTLRFPRTDDHPMALGRTAVYGYDTPLSVFSKLGGGRLAALEAIKAGITNRLSGGTILLNRLRRVPTD